MAPQSKPPPPTPSGLDELESIKDDEDGKNDRFYRDLEFGTGGLRGVIGAGTNRMNVYTVKKATQGLAEYILASGEKKSVAISCDSRIKSDYFSKSAAEVLAANGIKVHIYKELMPTPMLSWAVRALDCGAGVMVTASNNPAKYNGYEDIRYRATTAASSLSRLPRLFSPRSTLSTSSTALSPPISTRLWPTA